MSDTRYILFTGSMQPKNPMLATEDKINEEVDLFFGAINCVTGNECVQSNP